MAQRPGGTIFAPVSTQDPKHGRWILPLVVLALVAFTYTFVNNLPPAPAPTTSTVAGGSTTTTAAAPDDTTTTSLPDDVVAFIADADTLAGAATTLSETARSANDDYPDVTGYGGTKDRLSELKQQTADFVGEVDGVNVPDAATESWVDVNTAATVMQTAANDMLDGLVNTSGSEKRLSALDQFTEAATAFTQAIETAKTAATG
jgi:hypothetical protein